MNTKKILIVGGAGYIGSYVAKYLRSFGYETVILDDLSTGDRRAVPNSELVVGDMGDATLLESLFSKHSFAAVMHFAAKTNVGESVTEPALYWENNVCKTLTLLQTMIAFHVKKLVFSSTAAIFGIPQTERVAEDHPCLPINPYGMTKLTVERILRDFDTAYDLKSISLRYFNAAGGDPKGELKNFNTGQLNLIPTIIRCLVHQHPLTINGTDYLTPDGTCVRDYIHIHDLATAHHLALEQLLQGSGSGFYNLANGQGFSVREVVEAVQGEIGHEFPVLEGPRRPGDPPILVGDCRLARQKLHWSPIYPDIKKIIADALQASIEKVS